MAGAAMGGAELFFERLCIAQAGDGLDVLPVIRRNAGRAARLRAGGVEAHELAFGGRADLATGLRLRRLLKRFQPRVVVAWMNRAARLAPRGDWVLAGRLGGFYDLSYYRRCDHLIGNTRGIVRWLVEQGWPAARAHYLPNFAVDIHGAAPRRPACLPPGVPFVLALGRLHRNKAFDVLIRAMVHVRGAHLVIAGEGPERPALEKLARDLGVADRVHLPGWFDGTAGIVSACDLLVCPSRHEPLGNVIIEAFSAVRPVVAAAAQGPVELITDGGNGLLAPIEDDRALADAISAVLADPALAARLGQAGRDAFDRHYAQAPVLASWRRFLADVKKV
ncbi:glycosyltransferase [Nguyenibacter sp. L1]|uniref:glycosyltransferase n=1 Tax=Nguyenibacter sp. L1 TaxID=3049350 RepID=UPI002B45C9C0|nr:glycosyltransferase [Nguyenibacter sp. L1]WRH90006.1 glycosyltransferase [Nguyenibacter sp. L1]